MRTEKLSKYEKSEKLGLNHEKLCLDSVFHGLDTVLDTVLDPVLDTVKYTKDKKDILCELINCCIDNSFCNMVDFYSFVRSNLGVKYLHVLVDNFIKGNYHKYQEQLMVENEVQKQGLKEV